MSTTAAAPAVQSDRFGVPLKGWSLASLYAHPEDGEGCLVMVACENCGDGFLTDAPEDDTRCTACSLPPADVAALRMVPAPVRPAACAFCSDAMYGTDTDGTRHPRCARFVASLNARPGTRKDEPIAA
jgi:hypothetical protein